MFRREETRVSTAGRGTYDVTPFVREVVDRAAVTDGLATVFVHHTSASLLLTENADPDVRRDLAAFLLRLVPDGDALYRHDAEGPDDMPAHVRTALLPSSLTIPIARGQLDLGVWQGLFLWEHRTGSHTRRVSVTVFGA
ncbi:MAG: secondary thiamine-phosphate synthase enzyme YjbQ [Myxococcota bacterium]